jgi:hypothetical protein
MENSPSNPGQPEPSDPPRKPVRPPLAALFSETHQHEPDQVHPRTQWREDTPEIFVFVERRHGERRQDDTPIDEDRRHPEAGNRRRLPLMRALPGFHIDYEPQDTAPEAELLGTIPQFSQRIFIEQSFPDEAGHDDEETHPE